MANYVDKEELYNDLCVWQDLCAEATAAGQEPPRIPEKIGSVILDISNNLGNRHNFRNYTFIDEMISDGCLAAVRAAHMFDRTHEKKNPFGFFTFVIWRAFVTRIKKEKQEHASKMEMLLDETIDAYDVMPGDEVNLSRAGMIETYTLNH